MLHKHVTNGKSFSEDLTLNRFFKLLKPLVCCYVKIELDRGYFGSVVRVKYWLGGMSTCSLVTKRNTSYSEKILGLVLCPSLFKAVLSVS